MSRYVSRPRARGAFTIIELLVVVSILAILLGLAVPTLLGAKDKALRRKAVAVAKQLELAFSEYYTQNQCWPLGTPGPHEVRGTVLGALTGTAGVAYFELRTNTVDNFRDPWNQDYYLVAFDINFDNQITDHDCNPLPGGAVIRKSVIVWNVHINQNRRPGDRDYAVTNKSWE